MAANSGKELQLPSPTYRCGEFQVEAANRRFTRDGTVVPLEPRVFAVVLQLLARPGELVTRNELLDAVWGHRYVTPSTLNRVIGLARAAFGDAAEVPRFVQTVHGAGYRYIGPVGRVDVPPSGPPLSFAPPPIARLPSRVEALIGREAELTALAALFRDERAVTVLGAGGIGKTQCALECARLMAADFPDGVWFFDLIPMANGAEWLATLAGALAMPPASTERLLQKVCRVLQGRQLLIVIDNCDRIAADIGHLAVQMLRSTDRLKILATSQAPLNFLGERVMRLPPLAVPPDLTAEAPTPGSIEMVPAVAMLLARIRAVQPDFALTEGNVATIAEICRRLDGLPLALELAAPRFASLSPQQVLERLHQRFRFLHSEVAGRDLRHRNLLALLDWSFSLLSAEERRLLTWCSIFVQGWTVEGAIGFAAALGTDAETVVDLLNGLVNKSLITVSQNLAPPRYQLLETVREYGLEHIRGTPDEPRARRAHLAFVALMSQEAHTDILTGGMRRPVEQLAREHGNIDTALEYGASNDEARATAQSVVGSLVLYMKSYGGYVRGAAWCRQVLRGCDSLETLECGRALLSLAVLCTHIQAAREEPEAAYPRALHILQRHDSLWALAYAHGYYAVWLANWARPHEALVHVAECRRLAGELADPLLQGLAAMARGWVHLAQRENKAAIPVLTEALGLGKDVHQQHFIEMYLGLAHFGIDELHGAAAHWLEAMRGAAEVGNMRGLSGSMEGCGYIAARLGAPADAARLMGAALQIREQTDVPLFRFWLPAHERTLAALAASLGGVELDACTNAGRRMRAEDAANEARERLHVYARTPARPDSQDPPVTAQPAA